MQSRHGGNNVKIGCNTSGSKCTIGFWTCMDFKLSGARKKCLCWGGAIHGTLCKEVADQRGHLPAQASSTFAGRERSQSKVTQTLTWRTSELYMDGVEDYYMVEEMHWGAERGAGHIILRILWVLTLIVGFSCPSVGRQDHPFAPCWLFYK